MSDRFTFICVKTTVDFVVPVAAHTPAEFNRKVHNAFQGLVGGALRVGDLKDRPTQTEVPNHLLCDGSTISRINYPELVDFLAGTGVTEATLPDYTGPVEITVPTVVQETTQAGTVQTDATAPVDAGDVGGTQGGNVPSGGRQYDPNGYFPIWYIPPELDP